jgi:hypothetical protein
MHAIFTTLITPPLPTTNTCDVNLWTLARYVTTLEYIFGAPFMYRMTGISTPRALQTMSRGRSMHKMQCAWES